MLETVDADELLEWMVVYSEEPWGFEADAFLAGQIAATVANCTPRGPGAKHITHSDFYKSPWKESDQGFTPEQLAFLRNKRNRARKPKK